VATPLNRSCALAVLATLAAAAPSLGAPAAQAAAYRTCILTSKDQYPAGGKPTYNTALRARGATCTSAKQVMRAFHACRAKTSTQCSRKLLRTWRCSARTDSRNPVTKDFNAQFTCRSGARAVKGSYQQDV
jgi:hypothetical protein